MESDKLMDKNSDSNNVDSVILPNDTIHHVQTIDHKEQYTEFHSEEEREKKEEDIAHNDDSHEGQTTDDTDDENNHSIQANYWVEDEPVPVDDENSGAFNIYNYSYYNLLGTNSYPQDSKVSFNDIKSIYYFKKYDIEKDSNSYFMGGHEEAEDEDEENEYDQDYDDDDEEEDDEEYEDEEILFDHDEDEEESDEIEYDSDGEPIENTKTAVLAYQKQRTSQKLDTSSEEDRDDDDNDSDQESVSSVIENTGVDGVLDESILHRLRFSNTTSSTDSSDSPDNRFHQFNIRDSIDKTKLEKLKQQELKEQHKKELEDLKKLRELDMEKLDQQQQPSPTSTGARRSWTNSNTFKYIPKNLSPISSPNVSLEKDNSNNNSKVENEDDEEDEDDQEYDDVIIHDDIENSNLSDIVSKDKVDEEEDEDEEYNDDIIIHDNVENGGLSDDIKDSFTKSIKEDLKIENVKKEEEEEEYNDDIIIHDNVVNGGLSDDIKDSFTKSIKEDIKKAQKEIENEENEKEEGDNEEYNDDIIIHDDIDNGGLSDLIKKSFVETLAMSNGHLHQEDDENGSINWNDISESDLIDGEDENNEKILDIIKSRSILEGNLIEIRNNLEVEKSKLRDYFTKAKEELKMSIENVSKYYNDSTNLDPNNSEDFEKHRNELEEVSKSLVELEYKIVEIEESIGTKNSKSPTTSSKHHNSKPTKNQTKINSLLSEIVCLKEQIEKEKMEKLNQDTELKDITNHLLDMATQLSNALVNSSANGSLSSSVGSNSNGSSFSSASNLMDIENYRNQIVTLEKRLSIWKHHNEMLHKELMTDKQTNQKELLDLNYKFKKMEAERDRLSDKIDRLVQDKGVMEGTQQFLEILVGNLKNDNETLSLTISLMKQESEDVQNRFNQLVLELKEMGESTVSKLQDIINELMLERSQLQHQTKEAEMERLELVNRLSLVSDQLSHQEQTHQQLLLTTESTIKSLESSEIKCNYLQGQLDLANKRLERAESEVDRLTKEMDRLIKINCDTKEQQQNLMEQEHGRIKSSFSIIKEQALDIKHLLSKEKNEIIQLGTSISYILEKGRNNTSKTVKSLRDFVLKEVETTKLDINSKLCEIESNLSQNQELTSQIDTSQILLQEMNQQKNKLNEMQLKIVKMESQINEISETNSNNNNSNLQCSTSNSNNSSSSSSNNNNWERDQVIQLMKLENKIRKIEAGISEIIEYKSPQSQTPLPVATTTITTTTTTHHTYTNDNLNIEPLQDLSSPISSSPVLISTSTNNDEIEISSITEEDQSTNTSSNSNITTQEPIIITPKITPKPTINPNDTNSIMNVKSILLDSLLIGTGSILSIVFYQLMYHNKNLESLTSIFKSSLKYGLIFSSLSGIIKFTSTLLTSSTTLSSTPTLKHKSTSSPSITSKEIIVSSLLSASIFGGFFYMKNRNPINLIAGGLIGLTNGLLIKYKYK
ncbi:hypothetical protein DLAC_03495 [Tieghemostelium lacteum]|uniref:Uncharacterized protein n=1 Tax=Tieghemostelium lacteum TaxID=361077 RepID=A0A152A1A8_TIELA|nr:hypothetical protein DLAC_03495 [Tieghemostelium lacteum]|eukprot:KYQ99999.1 hypothetical protein DLAC_03495 [Tieghemostelium lacteum]